MKRWMKWAALGVMCLAASGATAETWTDAVFSDGRRITTVGVDSCAPEAVRGVQELAPGQVDTTGAVDLRGYLWARVFMTAVTDSMRLFVQKSWDGENWVHQDSVAVAETAAAYKVLYDSLYTRPLGDGVRIPAIPAPFLRFIVAQGEFGQTHDSLDTYACSLRYCYDSTGVHASPGSQTGWAVRDRGEIGGNCADTWAACPPTMTDSAGTATLIPIFARGGRAGLGDADSAAAYDSAAVGYKDSLYTQRAKDKVQDARITVIRGN